MAFETKEKRGSLFANDNKERENQPDFTGNVKIEGKMWRVAGWHTESRGGTKYISLSISDPADYQNRHSPTQSSAPTKRLTDEEFQKRREAQAPRKDWGADFADDDIPF
jgi:uncharacterized protein (DUF736 family)